MTELAEALARHRAGNIEGAERAYRAILAKREDSTALCNLGSILRTKGELSEAEALLRRAVALRPERTPARLNLANLLWRGARLAEAAQAYAEILQLDPQHQEAKHNLGCVYLALGRDLEGWTLYDERPERARSQRHALSFPEWRGEPLEGKRLLVIAEQGFGDQIFAARYLSGLAAEVTYACWPELCRLVAHLPVRLIPWRAGMSIPPHDYWTLAMSLPRWGSAAPAPYLFGQGATGGRVGVAWRGNALPDPGRSLPAALAAQLLSLPGAISLHPEDTGANDFQDTADIIAGLDAVISVDTSIAHLAGAMGKRTLVLLQHQSADWRWRDIRPWYPSVETLRQPAPGDWTGLIESVVERRLWAR